MIVKPQDVTDDHAINELVSSTLLRLKFQDRNNIREETHGVQNLAREETPELIRESLFQMDKELEALLSASHNHGPGFGCAYEQARSLPTTFVNDRDYRLKFLRCTLFDPAKAADKMIVHLDYLLLLFGPRALKESLKTNFFVKEEAVALREGYIQLLPFPDQSGRRVIVFLPQILSYTPTLRVKLGFFFCVVAMENAESQRRGVVTIAWFGSSPLLGIEGSTPRVPGTPGNKPVILPSGRSVANGLHARIIGIHFCFPDTPIFRIIRAFYVIAIGEHWRSRCVFHYGTKLEMQYKMMGYGIPVSQIPATDTGVVKVKNYNQWLRTRRLVEKDPTANAQICECPGLNDVLFRRAGSCLAHPGNARFKNMLESKKEKHVNSNQTEKRDIAWSIVELVECKNGRFLSWDTKKTCWMIMTDRVEIRQKVAMSIRDFNLQSKAAENQQSYQSSTNAFQHHDGKKRKLDSTENIFSPCNIGFSFKPYNTPCL